MKFKFIRCLQCNKHFTDNNVHTEAGWRETQISGFCENCFDKLFEENCENQTSQDLKDGS